ncbi:MAG: helix-turn-helix domain-containing protein [Thermoprotei archaeon]
MLTYFELASKVICPTLRAMVAYKLIKNHNFTQKEVANKLGIKQQAISNYMRGLRGHMGYLSERLSKTEKAIAWTDRIVLYIINEREKVDPIDITILLTEACNDILKSRAICEILPNELVCTVCKQQPINCPYTLKV